MNFGENNDFSNISTMPLGLWILLAAILFTQAIFLYQDAAKRNANKWIWGIWGLIQAPTPLIVYLFVVRKILSHNEREKKIRFILISFLIFIPILLVIVLAIFN